MIIVTSGCCNKWMLSSSYDAYMYDEGQYNVIVVYKHA